MNATDRLMGTDAEDIFVNWSAWKYIFGGNATDRIVLTGAFADYSFSWDSLGYLMVSGSGHTIGLRSVEVLQFSDQTLRLGLYGSFDLRANSYTYDSQHIPSVTALAGGDWLVSWQSFGQDGSDHGIYAQRYSVTGTTVGSEFRVNTYTTGEQSNPSVTPLQDGGWLESWQSWGQDGSGLGIYAQRYSATGTTVGSEFRVNTYTTGEQSTPSVAALPDGGWLVSWQSGGQDGSGWGIYAQRYSAAGATVGSEFRVNSYTSGNQANASATALQDGGWLVSWQSPEPGGTSSGIYAQRYGDTGATVGSEFRVNSYTSNDQSTPSVTALQDGGWLVSWHSWLQDGSDWGIYAQRYSASGATVGSEFRVNTYTSYEQSSPAVTALYGGGWLVSWQSRFQDESGLGIYAQRYSASGVPVGSEFVVNTNTGGDQLSPSVTALGDGGWLVSWQSWGQDGSNWGVYTQRFNASGNPVEMGGRFKFLVDSDPSAVLSDVSYGLVTGEVSLTLLGGAISGVGNELGNRIQGNAQHNLLDGGLGSDTLIGGTGNDTYVVERTEDAVIESAGEGADEIQSNADYQLPDHVETLRLLGTAPLNGTGNLLPNTLLGNSGANRLEGGAGEDTLDGQAGQDTLVGGEGDDVFFVDNALDVVVEATGQGADEVRARVTYTLPVGVERLLLMDGSAIDGTGNDQGNDLRGNNYSNRLDGGRGQDTLAGGDGNDVYVVDDAGDLVLEFAGQGVDEIFSSISFTLVDQVEHLTLEGTASLVGAGNALSNRLQGNGGGDSLAGLDGNDTILGGAGNDTLVGGAGIDSLAGGLGDDTYLVADSGDSIYEATGEGVDQVVSTISISLPSGISIESLVLSGDGALNGAGNEFNNRITGNALGNWLDGGAGIDTLIGGAGDDRYVVDATGDSLLELPSDGFDEVFATASFTLPSHVESLTLRGTTNIDATGNDLDNWLIGNGGDNRLEGRGGFDSLVGGAGNDTYLLTADSVWIVERAGEGTDRVIAPTSWVLPEHFEVLELTGSADLAGTGNALDNLLRGNAGANLLDGGTGTDTLEGGLGNDRYRVNDQRDVIIERDGQGADVIDAWSSYQLSDFVEELYLQGTAASSAWGNAGANRLTGNTAANTLSGGAGNDTLVGGAGQDYLSGGDGVDTAVFSGVFADYALSWANGALVVSGRDGIDRVIEVERLQFDDFTLEGLQWTWARSAPEATVNTYSTSDQSGPALIALADGGWLVSWQSADQDGSGYGVYAQRYSAAGTVAGSEFKVSTYTMFDQSNASVTALADGGWLVSWQSGGQEPGWGIYAQRYSATGATVGSEFRVNAYTTSEQSAPAVTALPDGSWYVIWQSREQDGSGFGVYHKMSSANGDFLANTFTAWDQSNPSAIGLVDGTSWLVSWQSADQDGSGTGIYAQRLYAGGGKFGSEFRVNTYTTGDQSNPSVAALQDGGWLVSWQSLGQDGSDYGIYAQRYDATGTARGGEFKVNTSTASRQAFPSATALPDGGWLVSWQSSGLDGALPGLFVQRYHVDGTASGPQVQVGTAAVWDAAAQAVLRDGSLALAWGTSLQEVAGLRMSLQVESQRTSGNDFVLATLKDGVWAGMAGDDFYVIDSTSDQVVERAAEGNDAVMSSISLVLPAHVENLMLTGASLTGRGNSLANRLQGNASANTLQGDEGHDTLDGGAGADTLIGGLGDDLYLVDHVGDVIGEGAGEGVDTVWAGVDVVLASGLEHALLTGSGAVSATGNALDNLMSGNSAANRLNGLAGDDTLLGGGGRDSIDGGDGADQIRASGGSNVLAGGRGADLFVLSALMSQSNSIMDFEPFDVLQLEDLAAITAFSAGRGAMLVKGAIDYEVLATGTRLHIGLDDRRGADAAVWLDGFANVSALNTVGNRLGTSLNRAPVVTELAPLAVRDRDVAAGQLQQQGRWMVSDPDADALSFGIEGAGQALSGLQVMKGRYGDLLLNIQTGHYSYTPDQLAVAALGTDAQEVFTLNVSDGAVPTSGLLKVAVEAINDAPFAAIPISGWTVRSGAGEQRISLDGVFSDFETPGALAFSVTGLPAGLSYDSAQKAILGSPLAGAVGVHNLTIRVEDSAGGFSTHAVPLAVLTPGVRVAFQAQGWRGDQESVTVNAYAFKRVMENALVRVEFDFNASTAAFEARVFSKQAIASGSFQLDLAGLAVDPSLKFTVSQKVANWQSVANVQAGHATFIGYNTDLNDTTKAIRTGDLIGVFAGTLQADKLVGGLRLERTEIGTQTDDSPLRWDILPARQSSWQGLDEGAYALSATAAASARSSISAADAYETLRIALGIAQTERLVSGQEFVAADVNRDGRVSVFDALTIAKTAAGLLQMPSQVVLNGNTDWQALSAANVSYKETIVLGALSEGSHSVTLVGIQLGDVSAVTPL